MKKARVIVVILLTIITAFSVMGCRKKKKSYDESKTQLLIGIQEGGFRFNWLERWIDDFQEMYKDHSFEEGKVGIEITYEPAKNLAGNCANTVRDSDYDIVFNEQTNHTDFFVKTNAARDISELVTTPLTEFGETESIADKLSFEDRTFF